jgi:hypothetical protein
VLPTHASVVEPTVTAGAEVATTVGLRATLAALALYAAPASLADIVRLRMFVTDAADCEPVLTVQGEVFSAIRLRRRSLSSRRC